MSDSSTTRLIKPYLEESSAPQFLSSMFQTPPENFFTTEKVEYDIMRDGEDIAIALPDATRDPREIEASKYTNKSVTPPVLDLSGTISAFDQTHRQPGETPFDSPDYYAHAVAQSTIIGHKCEKMIRRSVELMCSQVLQTGVVSLVDSAGATVFSCDFGMQSSHKTTPTAWAADGSTGAPIVDIGAMADIVRRDGKKNPDQLIFGQAAFNRFLANADVKQRVFNNFNSPNYAQLNPRPNIEDATFQGYVQIGNYRYEMWTYAGFYKHPQTGTLTPFVGDNKCIVRASKGRMDLAFGYIPLIVPPDARALRFMPPRIQSQTLGLDLSVNAWVTPNNKHVKISFGTRPLPIPTAIDTYGCITTN
jgi:hypothetical protein